jgi:hypothetical protein
VFQVKVRNGCAQRVREFSPVFSSSRKRQEADVFGSIRRNTFTKLHRAQCPRLPVACPGDCGTPIKQGPQVLPNDPMSKANEYRARAEAFAELARNAVSPQDRKRHLRMQRSYELLARSVEFGASLDQLIDHLKS